jgi:hypothetical protein
MINQVGSGQYEMTGTTKSANQTTVQKATDLTQAQGTSPVDTIQVGNSQNTSVTYSKVMKKKPDAADIAVLKAEADKATENLRKLVEELILKQNKNYKASTESSSEDTPTQPNISSADIEAAKAAISEEGEFGVKAVSDRLVKFAISVSGGDKSKLSELISAIDKGFAAARSALGSELPDICKKTYDETMKKLNDWAGKSRQT